MKNKNIDIKTEEKIDKLHYNTTMSWKRITIILVVNLLIECLCISGTFVASLYNIQMNSTFTSLANGNQNIIEITMLLMLVKTLDLSKLVNTVNNIVSTFKKKECEN
jgi:hypothetical protein